MFPDVCPSSPCAVPTDIGDAEGVGGLDSDVRVDSRVSDWRGLASGRFLFFSFFQWQLPMCLPTSSPPRCQASSHPPCTSASFLGISMRRPQAAGPARPRGPAARLAAQPARGLSSGPRVSAGIPAPALNMPVIFIPLRQAAKAIPPVASAAAATQCFPLVGRGNGGRPDFLITWC